MQQDLTWLSGERELPSFSSPSYETRTKSPDRESKFGRKLGGSSNSPRHLTACKWGGGVDGMEVRESRERRRRNCLLDREKPFLFVFAPSVCLFLHSDIEGGGCGCVNKNVVLLKFLDVGFNLVHVLLELFFFGAFAESVEFSVVRDLLELVVQVLPLFLEGRNQLVALLVRHQHFLLVALILLLNLHFAHQIVLILDLLLDLCDVLWYLAVCLLF